MIEAKSLLPNQRWMKMGKSRTSAAPERRHDQLHLRLDFGGRVALGPGKVRLMELIADHGSITAAGQAMGMSYRRAWLLATEINAAFAAPLIIKQSGGRGGGGAVLSALGREIIARYRRIEATTLAANADDIAALKAALRDGS
jgi:molybdate transport system regulatory protein